MKPYILMPLMLALVACEGCPPEEDAAEKEVPEASTEKPAEGEAVDESPDSDKNSDAEAPAKEPEAAAEGPE